MELARAQAPGKQARRSFKMIREVNVLIALIVLSTIIAVLNPRFLSPYNIQILIRQIALFAVIAVGETFVIITGGIDLSPGSMTALSGIICTLAMANGWSVTLAIIATLAMSALIGLGHGLAVTRLGIPPFIITLGTYSIARGAAAVITKGWPIVNIPASFLFLGQGIILGIPVPVIIAVAVAVFATYILRFSVIGRHIYAIGGNIEAARLSGIDVNRRITFCFITSAVLAGVTGIVVASRLGQGQPAVGTEYELIAIASSVIGGTSLQGGSGTVLGALIGASILSVLNNGLVLLEVSAYWHQIAVGCVVVIAVLSDVLQRRAGARRALIAKLITGKNPGGGVSAGLK
ncbi:MAG TPA: ABC transporter permease [Firmicutes bacterium]|nr:ABC transporter permease [Bacillota bacterium]